MVAESATCWSCGCSVPRWCARVLPQALEEEPKLVPARRAVQQMDLIEDDRADVVQHVPAERQDRLHRFRRGDEELLADGAAEGVIGGLAAEPYPHLVAGDA